MTDVIDALMTTLTIDVHALSFESRCWHRMLRSARRYCFYECATCIYRQKYTHKTYVWNRFFAWSTLFVLTMLSDTCETNQLKLWQTFATRT